MPKINKKAFPVGVFDSGLGGLTVVRALRRVLPAEDIVYFGDTARVPYGTKSKEAIIRFSFDNATILQKHHIKILVVACNSSSSYALRQLQESLDIPVVGVVEPGARKAVGVTRNKCIGVVATSATVASGSYQAHIHRIDRGMRVVSRPCPLFVPLAEEGWFTGEVPSAIAKEYIAPLKRADVDTLILGCTHYPLLKRTIQSAVGRQVILVDSAREVALEVKRILAGEGLDRTRKRQARYRFIVSDKPQSFKKIARRFLGFAIDKVELQNKI